MVSPASPHTGETTETDEDTLSDGPGSANRPQSAADPDPVLEDRDGLTKVNDGSTAAPIPIDQLETDQEHSNPRSDGAEDLADHLPLQKQRTAAPQGANPKPSLMAVKPEDSQPQDPE